ncbi:MAG: AMP-dependent synthetase/ligase [Jatrophihabitans sp.]
MTATEHTASEFTLPQTVATAAEKNVADYVFGNVATRPDHVSLRRRVDGSWHDVTSRQFGAEVLAAARGLINAGIQPGDRVGLMSRTRYEWTVLDFAILSVGAATVPIYETSSAEQVQWILSNSAAAAVVVETAEHAAVVESVRADAPGLKHVWVLDDDGLATIGALPGDATDEQVQQRRTAVTPEDLASIIYTSGTTGRPKGCQLTHANFIYEITQVQGYLGGLLNDQASTLLFIPIAHVFGRVIEVGTIATGCTLGHAPDVKNLLDDLAGFQPKFVLSVPRVFEKVYNTAKQKAHAEGHGKIFDRAEKVAIDYSRSVGAGSTPVTLKLQHKLFDKLVYGKIRAALGGNCEAAISGGAPLGERLGHFFRGVGVTVYEGYGLTETTAAATVNRPDAIKIGTVGQPLPGLTLRIAEDGELLMKGGVVFSGYWNNAEATAEAITDGWFHTGDIGEIDSDGFVRITGRKKELIVTAGGKNVAPAVLEDRARAHWLVSQCLVVGDQKPFIGALVTIDPESFPQWLDKAGRPADTAVADVVDDPELRAEIQEAIDSANKAVSKAESIRAFTILPADWTEEAGQITPSLKLKRNVVMKENAAQIAALYNS